MNAKYELETENKIEHGVVQLLLLLFGFSEFIDAQKVSLQRRRELASQMVSSKEVTLGIQKPSG